MPPLVWGLALLSITLLGSSIMALLRLRAERRRAELRLLLDKLAPSFDASRFSRALARAAEEHALQPELDRTEWLPKPPGVK